MKTKFKLAIEEYQCPGCVCGSDISCFKSDDYGIGCGHHVTGMLIMGVGHILLGMPKGFNRVGEQNKLNPRIFETYKDSNWLFNKFNVPIWKYLNSNGHTIVRGIMPRINKPFIHIFLENCIDQIECIEITDNDLNEMD